MVSNMYSAYGAEKMLLWLGHSLADDTNYDVEFVSLFDTMKTLEVGDNYVSHEFGIPTSGCAFKRYYNYFLKGYKKFNNLFKDNSYDYVVSFGQDSYYFLLLLRRKYRFKLVVSERIDPNACRKIVGFIRKKCYNLADKIVFQTQGAMSFYSQHCSSDVKIIPNPVDIPNEKWDVNKTRNIIINVGRLDIKQKRQDLLIKAFKEVLLYYPDYILQLCGDGNDRRKLELLVAKLGISDHVVFLGKVNNVNQYLLQARLFAFSSDYEGIPNVLMEAMALGMPVISTKCSPGGAELLITSGENGLLVEQGSEKELTNGMISLISNVTQSVKLAENARISMFYYSPAMIIQMWKNILC